MSRNSYKVTQEQFVTTWQNSNSVDEVVNALNMPRNVVLTRSASYRKTKKDGSPGVSLKKMPRKNAKVPQVETV